MVFLHKPGGILSQTSGEGIRTCPVLLLWRVALWKDFRVKSDLAGLC